MAPPQPSRGRTGQATLAPRGRGRGRQPRGRGWRGRVLVPSLTLVLVAALVPWALANSDGDLMWVQTDTPAAPEVVGEDGGVGTARAQAAQAQGASDTQTRHPAVAAGGGG